VANLLTELVERREQDQLLESMNVAFERQRGDEDAWRAEQDERRVWGMTLPAGPQLPH
jgi:hypothetical protein